MKSEHFAVINFYYTLVSAIGYSFVVAYQYAKYSYPAEKFRALNLLVLLGASVSHVTAIIFWTLAF